MSAYKNIFARRGKKKLPFGKKFKEWKIPLVKALTMLWDTLYEYDMLLLAVLKRRDLCMETIRIYKDKNGKAFTKAQKAALEADELTEQAESLRSRKIALWGDVARLYAKYNGHIVKGAIVALWICKDMGVEDIAHETKQTPRFVKRVLYQFRNFLCEIMELRDCADYEKQDRIMKAWEAQWDKENRRRPR